MSKESLGIFIKERRKDLNLSLRTTALRAEISPATLSKIENGLVDKPNEETLIGLAYALAVDIDELRSIAKEVSAEEAYYTLYETLQQMAATVHEDQEKYMVHFADEDMKKALPYLLQQIHPDMSADAREIIAKKMYETYKFNYRQLGGGKYKKQ